MKRDALDWLVTNLGSLYRARRLYPSGNEQVARAAERTIESLRRWGRPLRISSLRNEAVVEDRAIVLSGHPLELLLSDLAKLGRESVCLQPQTTVEAVERWVEALVKGQVQDVPGIATGSLRFEQGTPQVVLAGSGVSDYLELLPQVEEALAEVARERRQGLGRAREIVASIAGHLALGDELLAPVRDLKGHDDYTFTHALNVCVLSTALARSLGAPQGLLDLIALAGLCHDVGKQRIPVEVLNSPGALTPEERRVMDDHPAHGARLLLSADERIHPLIPVVAYQHHMGGDRSGYPKVPGFGPPHAASLIIAVADVFDAMRTVRPYRGARSTGEACTALLGDAAKGRLNRRHVCAFLGTFHVLRAGRRIGLCDGRSAVVLDEGALDPLEPTVETEDRTILDLSAPGGPSIATIGDRVDE